MASHAKYKVTAIGNAIVDVLAPVNDDFLLAHNVEKGGMHLIDEKRGETLLSSMNEPVVMSGGSAGNTIAGLAQLGASSAYIGKVREDRLGKRFRDDMQELGVNFDTPAAKEGASTARCFVFVTPDGERTMNTYLGACTTLDSNDVDEAIIADSEVTYLEGYLFDPPEAKKAFYTAAKAAHASGRKVALSLSDSFCVGRHKDDFLKFTKEGVDILFANEDEIKQLLDVTDFDAALAEVRKLNVIACLTRGGNGSVVVEPDGSVHNVDAVKVDLVDTTGAGDLYAAGFLHGYTSGASLKDAGRMGALVAGEIVSHFGARSEKPLKDLLKDAGLA